jgi:hypothetical protein
MNTMKCEELEIILEQSGGESLPAPAQAHLERCGMCRQLAAELERIVAVARELPAEVEPPERVWISLRAQLENERIIRTPAFTPERTGWLEAIRGLFARPALTGALLSLVVIGVLLFSLKPASLISPRANPAGEAPPVLAQAKIQLNNAEHKILSAGAGQPSEADTSLRHNLDIVNNFIAECEKTVQEDPQDDLARDYLSGAYQQKAELLAAIQIHTASGD